MSFVLMFPGMNRARVPHSQVPPISWVGEKRAFEVWSLYTLGWYNGTQGCAVTRCAVLELELKVLCRGRCLQGVFLPRSEVSRGIDSCAQWAHLYKCEN